MFCQQCGAENKEDANFCSRCGLQLIPIAMSYDNHNKKSDFNIYRVVWDYWWLISLFLGMILFAAGMYILSVENLAALTDPIPWILLIVGFMLFCVGLIRTRILVQRKIYDE
jgi:uncharacterized membrane protein YgdD (TMEM256/DUF423 family)